MAEPPRPNPVKLLSNFVGTARSFIHPREKLSQLKSILQEMPSGTLRHALSELPSALAYTIGRNSIIGQGSLTAGIKMEAPVAHMSMRPSRYLAWTVAWSPMQYFHLSC